MAGRPAEPLGLVENEFATVSLSIDHDGNSARLRIEDLRTGQVGFVDALELETLAWLPQGALHPLLDPSLHRWRESGDPMPDRPDRHDHESP